MAARPEGQYRHPKRKCQFCDNVANSREHVYPEWAKALLTERFPYRTHSLDVLGDQPAAQKNSKVKTKTGDPRASPLPVVCIVCNPNWMSRLQDQNKDLIVAIGDGSKTTITREEQSRLAKWVVMTAMVLETYHPQLSFSTKASRKDFAKTQTIPAGWQVAIARHQGVRFEGFNHFGSSPFIQDANGMLRSIEGVGLQCSAWVVAGVFFVAGYISPILLGMNSALALAPTEKAVRIYPSLGPVDVPTVTDIEADSDSRAPVRVPVDQSRRQWENATESR